MTQDSPWETKTVYTGGQGNTGENHQDRQRDTGENREANNGGGLKS